EFPCAWFPTAHTLLLAAPAAPASEPLRAGVGTTLQLLPLKCSARVWNGPLPVPIVPTAHMSPGPITAAADRDELAMNGLATTCRLLGDAAAGAAASGPTSTAASPGEKSVPTMRGFMFPHFPSLPWVRYVARLPVARVRLPSGSPSQDLFSERPLPAYRPQGPVRVASAARTVRLRYVEFGAGGGCGTSPLFLGLPVGGPHLAVRQNREGVELARDGHAAGIC